MSPNEAWKALLMSARTVALAIMASSMQLSSESGTLLLGRRAPAIAVSRGTEMSVADLHSSCQGSFSSAAKVFPEAKIKGHLMNQFTYESNSNYTVTKCSRNLRN